MSRLKLSSRSMQRIAQALLEAGLPPLSLKHRRAYRARLPSLWARIPDASAATPASTLPRMPAPRAHGNLSPTARFDHESPVGKLARCPPRLENPEQSSNREQGRRSRDNSQ